MLANMAQWAAIFGMGRSDDEDNGGGLVGSLIMIILAPLAAALDSVRHLAFAGVHGRRVSRPADRSTDGAGFGA